MLYGAVVGGPNKRDYFWDIRFVLYPPLLLSPNLTWLVHWQVGLPRDGSRPRLQRTPSNARRRVRTHAVLRSILRLPPSRRVRL